MQKEIQLSLPPEIAFDEIALQNHVQQVFKANTYANFYFRLRRSSIDARARQVKVNLTIQLFFDEFPSELLTYRKPNKLLTTNKKAIIVGCGPAGLFAALKLLELGVIPILIERGKDVKERRRDLAAIHKMQIVNPDSNYCFGEGGAGTYSDGKLYTRSDKRGDVRRILEILVDHGANENILVEAHPHIGTNKLPKLIEEMRQTILSCGGEIHFGTKVTDFILKGNEMKGVIAANGKIFEGIGVILATGHSAKDIFYVLNDKKIEIEAKPFAVGVRVEHSQQFIDSVQYHTPERGLFLPPSSYSLVAKTTINGVEKGVFSFCMCPGGIIAPCATNPGEVVVNGWSPSKRNNEFANSGIVVSVDENDWHSYKHLGALAGLAYQHAIEQLACKMAGNTQVAPAQRLMDFMNSKLSANLLPSSYQPGLQSVQMNEVLPLEIATRLKEGFKSFGNKMKGFLSNEAQIVGVESRTSSPVRIPRDKETLQHVRILRLFPCAEGAGYAGGIVSAAMDGERCAESLFQICK